MELARTRVCSVDGKPVGAKEAKRVRRGHFCTGSGKVTALRRIKIGLNVESAHATANCLCGKGLTFVGNANTLAIC